MAIFSTKGNSRVHVEGHVFPPKPMHTWDDGSPRVVDDGCTPEPHLAAAYGEMFDRLAEDLAAMTPQSPLTAETINPVPAIGGTLPPVTSHENDSEMPSQEIINDIIGRLMAGNVQCQRCALWVTGSLMDKHRAGSCRGRLQQLLVDQSVINAAHDLMILASRKRRERQNTINYCDCEDARTWNARQDEHSRAQLLASAMSTPLTFSKRIGWKPGAPNDA